MKHSIFLFAAIALLLAACAPAPISTPPVATTPPAPSTGETPTRTNAPAPTNTSEPPTLPGTPTPATLTPAQLAAMNALSAALGTPLDQIRIASTEAVDWPDACLGVTQAGIMCAQVITPGFKIVLESNARLYEYHTNADGSAVAAVTAGSVTLTWHREGGIAGFCDDLSVYLSGKAVASSCKTGETYPEGMLTAGELNQLEEWSRMFGALAVEMKDPAVADAMSVILTFNGNGNAKPTEADKQAMSLWAQEIYGRLKK